MGLLSSAKEPLIHNSGLWKVQLVDLDGSASLGYVFVLLWDQLSEYLMPIENGEVWVVAIDIGDVLEVQGGSDDVDNPPVCIDGCIVGSRIFSVWKRDLGGQHD